VVGVQVRRADQKVIFTEENINSHDEQSKKKENDEPVDQSD
jgi:hypothetical protein